MALFEVGNKKDYKSISSAIKAASNGDEIIVEPGYYAECFEINKELYIHSSLDLTKAKNNFSSDDIPIIYIRSFETLKISSKCRIENILFTQKKDLSFGLLSEVLVRAENTGEINGSDLIRDRENEEFQTMVEISSDVIGRNCFFVFAAYHGISILQGTSFFEKSIFSNCYGDNINLYNDVVLKLENNCFIKNTINGFGIYAKGKSHLEIEKSIFSNNECASIEAIEQSYVLAKECEFVSSEFGLYGNDNTNIHVNDCKLLKNKQGGIFCKNGTIDLKNSYISENNIGVYLKENANGNISETTISKDKQAGLYADGTSSFILTKSNIAESEYGIGLVENSTGIIRDSKIEKNNLMGVILNKHASCSLHNTQLIGINAEQNCCLYADAQCVVAVNNSSLKSGWAGMLLKGESKTTITNSSISNFSVGIRTEDKAFLILVHNEYISNDSGLFCGDESNAKIIENRFITHEKGGILLSDNGKIECYKCSFERNKKTGIFLMGLYENKLRLISCIFSDNIVAITDDVTFTKEMTLINCIFNNNTLNYHNCSNIKNINSVEEEKKLYKQLFEKDIKDLDQVNIVSAIQKSILSVNSIDVISNCLSQINEEFDKDSFYVKNLKKLQSICKDLYPKNEDEISFILMLSSNGLLEQLANKKLKKDFPETILHIANQYIDKTNIGILIKKLEVIFQVPIQDVLNKASGDE